MAADDRATPEAVLLAEYRRLANRVEALLREARQEGRSPTFLEGQLRAIQREVVRIERRTAQWVEEELADAYRISAGAAQQTLEGGRMIQPAFTGVDRRAVRALQERVSDNLGLVRQRLSDALVLGDPRRGARQVAEAVARQPGLTRRGEEVARAEPSGLRVRTPSGSFWRIDAYARMLTRTAVADARRVAFRSRYLQNGVDVVVVVANGTTHDVCLRWEGERLSLTGSTRGLPTVADARRAGLFHPQCRHRYVVDTSAPQPGVPLVAPDVPEPEAPLPTLGFTARGPLTSRAPREARL